MTLLPTVTNRVRPWFDAYGATLDDAQSFQHMIGFAEEDIASLEKIMPELRGSVPDIAAESEAELIEARDLVIRMKSRLAAIQRVR